MIVGMAHHSFVVESFAVVTMWWERTDVSSCKRLRCNHLRLHWEGDSYTKGTAPLQSLTKCIHQFFTGRKGDLITIFVDIGCDCPGKGRIRLVRDVKIALKGKVRSD